MGTISTESPSEFLDLLKQAGIAITNEEEVRERLGEVSHWRYAFATLAGNGRSIGIGFKDLSEGRNREEIHRAFAEFQFPDRFEAIFNASLLAEE